MTKGGVSMRNSAWRFGASAFAGDILYFAAGDPTVKTDIMRNGWVRDGFRCEPCDATLIYDGRKASPLS